MVSKVAALTQHLPKIYTDTVCVSSPQKPLAKEQAKTYTAHQNLVGMSRNPKGWTKLV